MMNGDDYEHIDYFIGMDTREYKKEIQDMEEATMSKKMNKLKEEIAILEAEEKAKRKKWHMFEDAGCYKCGNSGYELVDVGGGFGAVAYNKIRCKCSTIKTERYKKAKANKDIPFNDYEKKMAKFVDNNAKCNSERANLDRSW